MQSLLYAPSGAPVLISFDDNDNNPVDVISIKKISPNKVLNYNKGNLKKINLKNNLWQKTGNNYLNKEIYTNDSKLFLISGYFNLFLFILVQSYYLTVCVFKMSNGFSLDIMH